MTAIAAVGQIGRCPGEQADEVGSGRVVADVEQRPDRRRSLPDDLGHVFAVGLVQPPLGAELGSPPSLGSPNVLPGLPGAPGRRAEHQVGPEPAARRATCPLRRRPAVPAAAAPARSLARRAVPLPSRAASRSACACACMPSIVGQFAARTGHRAAGGGSPRRHPPPRRCVSGGQAVHLVGRGLRRLGATARRCWSTGAWRSRSRPPRCHRHDRHAGPQARGCGCT